jgi:predicted glycogen debranching enzyme
MIDFGREVTGNQALSLSREWLVTNGIGGYATGTISGVLTRVYHGLLVAALEPPLGRTVLLTKFDEIVEYDNSTYELFTNQWAADDVNPHGYLHLERFRLGMMIPIWTYAIADARLEKRVFMRHQQNTTYIQYHYRRGTLPLKLTLKAIVNYKDSHNVSNGDFDMSIEPVHHGLKLTAFDEAVPFYLYSDRATVTPQCEWYRGYYLAIENERGLPDETDHLYAAQFEITLQVGESVTFVASTELDALGDAYTAYSRQQQRIAGLLSKSRLFDAPPWIQHLVLAADQFIVRRQAGDDPDGRSIIAGYHWFGDWGRDTMIALPVLTLTTKRYDEAAKILRTFAQFVDKGMLPNRFPDVGDKPEYNTVDATLWYFEAIRQYYDAAQDMTLIRDLYPVLQDIISWHIKGTRYSIHVDPKDGLLYSGEEGVQLTWMDAKIEDWVVTPRTGKAVEINALWYNALRSMADFARLLGEVDADEYDTLANRVESSFSRFWNDELGYCYDVIDTPTGNDSSLRPNQLFACSLENSPLKHEQIQSIVDICGRKLLTSIGLRSLSPDHADYKGDFDGTPYERDSRYHQGTVWAWLIGAYALAHYKAYNDKEAARAVLEPFQHHLADYCVGSITEVAQGNEPFVPKGAVAQAWSVAEVLRAWMLLK